MPTEEIEPGSPVSEDETPTGTFAGEPPHSRFETLSGAAFASGDTRTTVGHYRLLQRVGEGGMGEVWEAEQLAPVKRRVAVKVIKEGMDTRTVVARFEAERQALALMNHPGVARVFDAGVTPEGRPFFAMEFVKGEPINFYCDRHRLTTRDRLALVLQVCEGIQHAHHKGVIHRDLKPSNILVTVEEGGSARTKIIDFGLAKAMHQPLTDRTLFTELGHMLGTPEYMSPEQAEAGGVDVDTRTDVYSLGVVLYELLTGALPFDSKSLRQASLAEIQRRIREDEPPRPSTRVSSLGDGSSAVAERHQTEAALLVRRLRGDLDAITMKALEKDRTRRYDSPADLAADLRRHLGNEPVLASPPSTAYRLRKFVRRHKAVVAIGAVVVLALVAGIAGTTEGMLRARAERDRAEQAREEMEGVVGFLVGLFRSSDPSETLGETVTARQLLDRGAERIGTELSARPLTRARMLETMGLVYGSLGLIDVAERMQREAFAIREKDLGPGHVDVARSLERLSRLAYDRGDYPGAEKLSRQALEIYRRARGEVHLDVARTLSDVGSALSAQGDEETAERIYRETLQVVRELPGIEPKELEVYVRRLAVVLDHRKKNAEAEPLYRESLDLARKAYGPVHPRVAIALDNLAIYFDGIGDVAQAERLYRESLAMLRKVYGEEHPEVAQTMGNLGDFFAYTKGPSPSGSPADFVEAEALHREALEINLKRRPDHPFTGDNYAALAHLRHRAGDNLEAERLVREALRIYRLKLSEDSSKTVAAKKELAEILQSLGRPAEGTSPSPEKTR